MDIYDVDVFVVKDKMQVQVTDLQNSAKEIDCKTLNGKVFRGLDFVYHGSDGVTLRLMLSKPKRGIDPLKAHRSKEMRKKEINNGRSNT